MPDLNKKYNVGGVPRNWYKFLIHKNPIRKVARKFVPQNIKETFRKIGFRKPEISFEDREYLKHIFREDILKLQNLINRDLSHWLK